MIDFNEVQKQRNKSIELGNKKMILASLDLFTANWQGGIGNNSKKTTFDTLELFITPECNLKCKYCYINKHKDELFLKEIRNSDVIFENAHKIIKWLIKNDYRPKLDIFTGEAFGQELCFKIFNMIIEEYSKVDPEKRIPEIMIPTNFTFIANDKVTERVSDLFYDFNDLGINFFLSASIEGKYMEQNRPYKHDLDIPIMGDVDKRDDEYYDKVFKFVKKFNCGLHPMLYGEGMHLWKKNFLWFQEMFTKYDIYWTNLMLLQVRDENWTAQQIKDYGEFVEWCMKYTYSRCKKEGIDYVEELRTNRDFFFSLLAQGVNTTPRGLTCGIQSTVAVRLGDMRWIPCHRTAYPGLDYAQFVFNDEGDMIDIFPNKVELIPTILGLDKKSLYGCSDCHISELCLGQCLGSCYESLGNMFTPIPTVCSMTQSGLMGLAQAWMDVGIFDEVITKCASTTQQSQWEILKEMMTNGKLRR